MDFATCEKCRRTLHESIWLQNSDSVQCPACGMSAVNVYSLAVPLSLAPKKSVVSAEDNGRTDKRRIA
jgi:hypothetical protein